jgi:tetratricopeptide (TPR) repeat protein
MLPTLRETEPASVAQVVPNDLIEEIDRAKSAKAKGWLRLLATEVAGRRFQWPALRLIGHAQWEIEDWDGARKTFERVRENDPHDIPANLALANVYERTYRRDPQQEDMLRRSDQAIERVLSRGDRTTEAQRAEALGLKGRNRKTEWRLGFAKIGDLAARRKNATNLALRRAYEDYREAYLSDLNHFWPGLAALQLGTIALERATRRPGRTRSKRPRRHRPMPANWNEPSRNCARPSLWRSRLRSRSCPPITRTASGRR